MSWERDLPPIIGRIGYFWEKFKRTQRMPPGMAKALDDLVALLGGLPTPTGPRMEWSSNAEAPESSDDPPSAG